jgi:septal ring factor EnvC (AmiA/AmiB activator)
LNSRPRTEGSETLLQRALPGVLCGRNLFLVIALIALSPAYAADKAELDALHGRIETLKKNLTGAEENRSEASDALRASEHGVSEANRVLHNIGMQQRVVRADLIRVEKQSRALESGIAAQQSQLGQLLAMRYASGQQDYLRLLLSGRDPNQTARDLHYYSYISRAQADFIRALRDNLAGLAQLAREARDKSAELAELKAQQREGRKELLAQQAERRNVLARLATQIRSQRREIKSLQRDEARLSRLV